MTITEYNEKVHTSSLRDWSEWTKTETFHDKYEHRFVVTKPTGESWGDAWEIAIWCREGKMMFSLNTGHLSDSYDTVTFQIWID